MWDCIQLLVSLSNTETITLSPNTGGDVTVSGEVIFDSDQMTLTCISTGGPATTVTWTRDSIIVTVGTETVLDCTVHTHSECDYWRSVHLYCVQQQTIL